MRARKRKPEPLRVLIADDHRLFAEALEAILSRVGPLGAERVDVLASLGRTLAEAIVSRRVIPPWANSSMDGYAVRAADTGKGATLSVVGRVEAGALPARAVGRGEAMRIFTGAPLPSGTDAVVPQEDVDAADGHVTLRGAVEAAAYVRAAGEWWLDHPTISRPVLTEYLTTLLWNGFRGIDR